jgi:HEPN superfamily protein
VNCPLDFDIDPSSGEFRLKGRSNLYAQLLRENCQLTCLSCIAVDTHHWRLDMLVNRRNDIAHGEKEYITDISEYQPFEHAVLDVLCDLEPAPK